MLSALYLVLQLVPSPVSETTLSLLSIPHGHLTGPYHPCLLPGRQQRAPIRLQTSALPSSLFTLHWCLGAYSRQSQLLLKPSSDFHSGMFFLSSDVTFWECPPHPPRLDSHSHAPCLIAFTHLLGSDMHLSPRLLKGLPSRAGARPFASWPRPQCSEQSLAHRRC